MTQKEIAIQCLERLNIYKPYIRKFKSATGTPCYFENYAGFWVDQEPEIWNKVKEVEAEFGCLVYALTHELTEFGECWSMLCISSECESAVDTLVPAGSLDRFYAFSYVWNKSNEDFSEFGDIVVKSFGGGIRRIG